MTFPGSVTYLKLMKMKPKGLGELCAATSDLANQTGIKKQIFCHPQAELDILSFKKKTHINGPWKPEARNRARSSFYACPGYQQL